MRSGSIGIRAASLSRRFERAGGKRDWRKEAGFTLVEALVALTLVLAFAAALGPHLFQARHILSQGDGRVRAHLLLRSLLQTPFDRGHPQVGLREGETGGFRWRVSIEPNMGATPAEAPVATLAETSDRGWLLYRVKGIVSWGQSQTIAAETLRLGRGS
jgi:general secretion pathway protein I